MHASGESCRDPHRRTDKAGCKFFQELRPLRETRRAQTGCTNQLRNCRRYTSSSGTVHSEELTPFERPRPPRQQESQRKFPAVRLSLFAGTTKLTQRLSAKAFRSPSPLSNRRAAAHPTTHRALSPTSAEIGRANV